MNQKPKAYVKTKYLNYFKKQKTTTIKPKQTQKLSNEYIKFNDNLIKIKSKFITKEQKNKIQKQINNYKHNKNKSILTLLHTKYNNYNFDYIFK